MEIKQNSFYGLIGFAIPALILLIAYPILVKHLGTEVFGIYVLATSISGAIAFLDFGFSTATLKFVAEYMGKKDPKSVANVIITSLLFYGGLGSLGAIIIWMLSPWLSGLFSIDEKLSIDAMWAFRLSSIQFAISFLMMVFISLFKGLHKFNLSTLCLIMLSILNYGGVILAIFYANVNLVEIMIISLMANFVVLIIAIFIGYNVCQHDGIELDSGRVTSHIFKGMFNFGSALAICSILGYLHGQMQKIIIGVILGPQYVTYFHLGVWAPAKVNAGTLAMTEPLFPKIAASIIGENKESLRTIYLRYIVLTAGMSFLALCPLWFFSEFIFEIWFGENLPLSVATIASIVSIGLFINAIGQPTYHAINGIGQPWINTAFSIVSPFILYSILAFLFLSKKELVITDFAWATSISLIVSSLSHIIWYEWYVIHRKTNT